MSFLFKEWQVIAIQTWVFGRHFLRINKVSVPSRKTTVEFVANEGILSMQVKLKFWKLTFPYLPLGAW